MQLFVNNHQNKNNCRFPELEIECTKYNLKLVPKRILFSMRSWLIFPALHFFSFLLFFFNQLLHLLRFLIILAISHIQNALLCKTAEKGYFHWYKYFGNNYIFQVTYACILQEAFDPSQLEYLHLQFAFTRSSPWLLIFIRYSAVLRSLVL